MATLPHRSYQTKKPHQHAPHCHQREGVLPGWIQQMGTPPGRSVDKLDQHQVLVDEIICSSQAINGGGPSEIRYEHSRRGGRRHAIQCSSHTIHVRACGGPRHHRQSDRNQRDTTPSNCCLAFAGDSECQYRRTGNALPACAATHDADAYTNAIPTMTGTWWTRQQTQRRTC